MKDGSEFHICDCSCHTNPDMSHCRPCCEICSNCHQNIKTGHISEHAKECQATTNNADNTEAHPRMRILDEPNDGAC